MLKGSLEGSVYLEESAWKMGELQGAEQADLLCCAAVQHGTAWCGNDTPERFRSRHMTIPMTALPVSVMTPCRSSQTEYGHGSGQPVFVGEFSNMDGTCDTPFSVRLWPWFV